MSELTQRLSVALHQVRVSDANKIVGAFKNKIVSAVIVGGAIIIAIPICIFRPRQTCLGAWQILCARAATCCLGKS